MKNFNTKNKQLSRETKKPLFFLIRLMLILGITSCSEDYWVIENPSQNSRAYIALTWSEDEPDYIDAGTSDIPEVFYWNDYYPIRPGYYTLYYDGIYNDGYNYIDYAWEVEYEIYTNGGVYTNDNYFSLDMNPYGPLVYEEYKSNTINSNFTILEQTEFKIVILKQEKEFSLKITYLKVERRQP